MGNLEGNRESLEKIKIFSRNLAQFFCVEGHDKECDTKIMEKYAKPYDQMLAGENVKLSGCQHDNFVAKGSKLVSVVERYKQEMLASYCPAYDEDLSYCDSIIDIYGLGELQSNLMKHLM